ncbi:uncharacterized protein PpBr36_11445 [Pyricularia pennisetigena]|uniref:uncharacterized protein n=1 Tax=Pyricularia pennisetigena TaxID=1578925 RepID=UPI00114F0D31|nr:uncharacterized protein PpBr36_11445 [Pyricularia pennisetigena]TLS20273.1 hypothetical protein PpBr36_11445 [Pyricularia pennisetigena]
MFLGRRWHLIVEAYHEVCKKLEISAPSQPSILFLVSNHSYWERTNPKKWTIALTALCNRQRFYQDTIQHNTQTKVLLGKLKGMSIDQFATHNNTAGFCLISTIERIRFIETSVYARPNPSVRPYTTRRLKQMSANHMSVLPVTGRATSVAGTHTGLTAKAFALLLLLSFSIKPGGSLRIGLLKLAGSTKLRWDDNGYPLEDPASSADLKSDIAQLLCSKAGLERAFDELYAAGVASLASDDPPTVTITATGYEMLAGKCEEADIGSWKRQALIVACRAVSFKYLGFPNTVEERTSLKSYLEHTLKALRAHYRGFEDLSPFTRVEVALCLIEASRFPGMAWKRSILVWAKEVMGHYDDVYVDYGMSQRLTVVRRLEGDLPTARQTINRLLTHDASRHAHYEEKGHLSAVTGHAVVEQALNCFQEEQLATANSILSSWKPLSNPPCPAENTVVFRGELLRAKISRYQGEFARSLASIQICREIVSQHHPKTIVLEDDLASLACEHADALRELDRLQEAEEILDEALATSLGVGDLQVLSLCRAEVLFAQDRLDEAKAACQEYATAVSLTKMAKLRLCITRAKISHLQAEWSDALFWWTEALKTIAKFPPTSGHATWAIHVSVAHILQHQNADLRMNGETQARGIADLKKLATKSEALCWIAGLRHWYTSASPYPCCEIRGFYDRDPAQLLMLTTNVMAANPWPTRSAASHTSAIQEYFTQHCLWAFLKVQS